MGRWQAAAVAFAVVLVFGRAAADNEEATRVTAASEDVVVAADGSSVNTTHTEIAALNEAGAMQASRISVFYDSELQKVEILEAHTLKKDGSKIPIDVGSIYEQLPPDNTLAVTGFRIKILLFPQFSAGDTAVYTVRFTTQASFTGSFTYGKYFPRGTAFNGVHVTITAPKTLNLKIETHEVPFTKTTQGENAVYSWRMTAAKTKAPPMAVVSPLDREPRFFVSSFKDYTALGAAYAAQAEPKAATTDKIKAQADQITADISDRREQTRLIYQWVAKQIRYVAIELGRGSFIPHDADSVLAKGYGDCKDHDIVLQALLKAKGIAANSVLINADNAYTLSDVPTFAQLNHVITYVPEFDLYLDSTAAAPFAVLPLDEYGKPAVRAAAKTAGKIAMPLLAPGIADVATTTTAILDDKGGLTGTTKIVSKGPHAITARYVALGIQAIGAEKVAKSKLGLDDLTDGSGSFTMDPPMELAPSYTLTGTFSAKGLSDWLDHGKERSMPKGLRLASAIGTGMMGPLDPDKDIDYDTTPCASGHETEDIALTLPAGTRPAELPANFSVDTPALTFVARWKFDNGIVSLHREFTSHVSQPLCSGALRKAVAETLKKILDGSDPSFRLTQSKENYDRKLKDNSKDVDALIQRGNSYSDKKQYDLALQDYNDALAIDPKKAWALNARGVTYMDMGKLDLALADFDRALALEPDFVNVWYNRGLVHTRSNELDKAVDDFTHALKIDKTHTDALIDRGRVYQMQHKFDLALTDYDAAIAAKPQESRAYSNRASLRIATAKIDAALADCTKAIQLSPNDAWTLGIRSMIYSMRQDYQAALKDLNAALKINPNSTYALHNRALVFQKLNRPADAVGDFDAALKENPNDPSLLLEAADCHRSLKQWDQAEALYNRAIAQKPGLEAAHAGKLSIKIQKGQTAQALHEADALIAANPDRGWPYLVRSLLKRELGDDKAANQDVAKAEKLEPTLIRPVPSITIPVRQVITGSGPNAAIAQGQMALSQYQYESAATAFERAIKQGANDSYVLPMLCVALAHTARTDDAAYQCSRALQLRENDGELLEMRGYAYFRRGKFREALADFGDAARIFSYNARYIYERGVTKKKLGDASGDADIAKAKKIDANVAQKVPPKMAL